MCKLTNMSDLIPTMICYDMISQPFNCFSKLSNALLYIECKFHILLSFLEGVIYPNILIPYFFQSLSNFCQSIQSPAYVTSIYFISWCMYSDLCELFLQLLFKTSPCSAAFCLQLFYIKWTICYICVFSGNWLSEDITMDFIYQKFPVIPFTFITSKPWWHLYMYIGALICL